MKKVLVLCGSLKIGGTETSLVSLINFLIVQNIVDVKIILYGNGTELKSKIKTQVLDLTTKSNGLNNSTWNKLKGLLLTRLAIINNPPDYILSYGEVWNNFAIILSSGLGIKKTIADRGDFNYRWPKLHRFLRWVLYDVCDWVILQKSSQLSEYVSFIQKDKIKVIKNHFDESKINRLNDLLAITPKENLVVTVSRFIPTKRVDLVIKIFAQSNLQNQGFKLVVVGEDDLGFELKTSYLKLIVDLGLEEHVEFRPANTDVIELLTRSKAFLFASSSEGMPNVLIEALYANNYVFTLQDHLDLDDKSIPNYVVSCDANVLAKKLNSVTELPVLADQEHMQSVLNKEFNTNKKVLTLID